MTAHTIDSWIEALEMSFSQLSDADQAFVESVRDEFDQWCCLPDSSEKRLKQLYDEKVL